MKEKIGMAHSALTNLQRLLEVTSMAMIDTKTQLSTVMRYIIIIYWDIFRCAYSPIRCFI